jgi:hypothetical protein
MSNTDLAAGLRRIATRPSADRAGIPMMDDDRRSGEAEEPQGSVFGNLPGSRPGIRSPRRDAAQTGPERERAAKPARKPRAAPAARPVAARPSAEADPSLPDDQEGGGLEDLAWAGIAAAAEAATIGVRLASRAMEALHETVDRR